MGLTTICARMMVPPNTLQLASDRGFLFFEILEFHWEKRFEKASSVIRKSRRSQLQKRLNQSSSYLCCCRTSSTVSNIWGPAARSRCYSFLKNVHQNVSFFSKNVLSPAKVPITGYQCRYIVLIYARWE